jgi:hypothetical protein
VLRGRGQLPFERSLGVLADVATRELPRYLVQIPGGAHFIIAPAYLRGVGPRLYSIDNVVSQQGKQHSYRFTKHQNPNGLPPRIAVAGSGAPYILRKPRSWYRPLLNLIKVSDRGEISDILIADQLAAINYEIYEAVAKSRGPDKDSVGPRSVVVWKRRPEVGGKRGGGAHQFYTGTARDRDSPAIPSIGHGMDIQAVASIFMEQMQKHIPATGIDFTAPPPDLDTDEIGRRLAALPPGPDEKLR